MGSVQSILSKIGSVLSLCCPLSSNDDGSNRLELRTHDSPHLPSSSPHPWSYDVFLSFRGEDTRKNFTDHLYTALDRAGIRTFRDDDKLDRGEEVGPSLLKAIQESRISIPVFSRNYASSKWCLDELAKMVECRNKIGQTVLPIFFDAEPSDVRSQTGSFAKAFQQHNKRFEREKVKRWREALGEAGKLSGWNLKEVANGHESKLIHLVVKKVLSELNNTLIDIAKHPVGIGSHMEKMMGLLQVESKDVLFVGICGMGGIGKTTIAKAVLNQISSGFQCFSFLADIRETSLQRGLGTLQKQLLENILYERNDGIDNVDRGKMVIKERLHSKKVLIILDDVNHTHQLDALVGESNWFGPGSRIIITTRDEHVLNLHQVDSIYKPKELDFNQSLQLFSKHAFGRDQPLEDYRELSKKMVRNVGGLPLALEILGSFLFDKKTPIEWESTLDKLKKIPLNEVQERLKISYEGLDDFEKDIFLDIACFFIGEDKEIAINILDGCDFPSRIGITVLIHKSFVKIDDNNELRMHDQIRDMGREIVRRENHREPGMRSRLWMHEDALGVLKKQTGTVNVEGLHVNFEYMDWEPVTSSVGVLSTKSFVSMSKLRLLRVSHAHIEGEFEHLPRDLRWLSWQGCPLEYIPTTFHLQELVVLDLSWSHVTQVWNCLHQNKVLEKLKVLDLRHCASLTRTPNLSGLPSLERLILEGCVNLVEVDESIWHLRRLIFLDLKQCVKLKKLISAEKEMKDMSDSHLSHNKIEVLNTKYCKLLSRLPDLIGNLRNLKSLYIDYTPIKVLPDSVGSFEKLEELTARECRQLVKLPTSMGKMKSLKYLAIGETGITELPEDFGMLLSLEKLVMNKCKKFKGFFPDTFSGLLSLEEVHANDCNISEGGIPSDFGRLSSLKKLILNSNYFCSLPASITTLSQLQTLELKGCTKLHSLPELPSSLTSLQAGHCISMEILPDLSNLKRIKKLNLAKCGKLVKIQGLQDLEELEELGMSRCTLIKRLPDLSKLKKLKNINLWGCGNVAEIQGLESLEALEELNMCCCTSMERLPDLSNLKKLKILWLMGCGKLAEIQGLEGLEALEFLDMSGCKSIERLPGMSTLKKLRNLWLRNCEKLAEIRGLEDLKALEELDLSGLTSIERLPDLLNLKSLKILSLKDCKKLTEIQCLEGLEALEVLDMSGCLSIERLSGISTLKKLRSFRLQNCEKLAKIQGLEGLEALEELDLRGLTSMEIFPDLPLKKLKNSVLAYCEEQAGIPFLEDLEAVQVLDVMSAHQ